MKNMLVIFHNKENAEKLKNMGFSYIIDYADNKPNYVFILNENVYKILNTNFDNHDYHFSNRLNFSM